ncbi:GNAT family N-acetyltransferase [Acidaminobacter hydrogenoformans]|uniref:Acetyltransferase (GNAT) family protein n=1 Tax=Acidaminobacter hydrogenoformans DSM 2784 TaxID=1120920 RepID=A0A1G5S2Q9_9FIRM|nr:GNAT family N-acetyltransferase [Acidaminobacter hydrogenoformans]SCZ80041.1 Acetyltransferase (GNAT) family protein [Acidaminobacter hydrogenoformans DSM 2784]
MIEYRTLEQKDCSKIKDIDASQYIGRAWRKVEGQLQLVKIDYLDPSWPNGYETHYNNLLEAVEGDGAAVGAFDPQDKMLGFVALKGQLFGETARYMLLDQLFITREARGKGLGRQLFGIAAETARGLGAEKLYICAGSAEETIAFYHAVGCVAAVEINPELFDGDPRDLQLEYVL